MANAKLGAMLISLIALFYSPVTAAQLSLQTDSVGPERFIASLGGQSTQWDAAASAYILSEATRKYSAFIGSSQVISHDEVLNSAQPGTPGKRLAFAVRAGRNSYRSVTVVVARNDEGSSSAMACTNYWLTRQAIPVLRPVNTGTPRSLSISLPGSGTYQSAVDERKR